MACAARRLSARLAKALEKQTMDRHWLITWTCYGARLPGAVEGFVGNIREEDGKQVRHNVPGTPVDADMPRLEAWVREQMAGPPVQIGKAEADAMIAQYRETARVREWILQAASIMYNHTHALLSVPGDPDPELLLQTLKSSATRALKKIRALPPNGTFWTANGSKRNMPDEGALAGAAVCVVKKQPNPLAVWHAPTWQEVLDKYERLVTP
jgi:hypothetical protein